MINLRAAFEKEKREAESCVSESFWAKYPAMEYLQPEYLAKIINMHVSGKAKAAEQQREPGREKFTPVGEVYAHRVSGVINRLHRISRRGQAQFVKALDLTGMQRLLDWADEEQVEFLNTLHSRADDWNEPQNSKVKELLLDYKYISAAGRMIALAGIVKTCLPPRDDVIAEFADLQGQHDYHRILQTYMKRAQDVVERLRSAQITYREQFIDLIDQDSFSRLVEWCAYDEERQDPVFFLCDLLEDMEERWTRRVYEESEKKLLPFTGQFDPFDRARMDAYDIFLQGAPAWKQLGLSRGEIPEFDQ